MAVLQFGTKAETLASVRKRLASAQVKPLHVALVSEWQSASQSVLKHIASVFESQTVIVRSSVLGEDSLDSSHAGEFTSVAHVDPADSVALTAAIERVIESYGEVPGDHQFFVQEQITDIEMCGVMMTCDIDTCAPYYVVNYDDETSSHDSVTSGLGTNLKTWACFRNSPFEVQNLRLKQLITTAQELESLFDNQFLDIEFAFDHEGSLFVLQVRPVVLRGKPNPATPEHVETLLFKIQSKFQKLSSPHYNICGKRGIFSVMSDWNPAEMIGIKPRPLALSLYKELITDSVWAYQRDNYGYRNLRSFPLMISFMGYPYIDVRASFNSFVPATLDDGLAEKLVNFYLDQLADSPADHDKVEFNIVFSCYFLSLPKRIKRLLNHGFSELELDRIKFALLSLTNQIVSPATGLYRTDALRIQKIGARFEKVTSSELTAIEKIYWLVEDCKRYGTLPFAGLARAAFIAVQFLQSFVELGIITEDEKLAFLNSLNTVARQLGTDSCGFQGGVISRAEFLRRYGHLRPGTYDILSPTYAESFDTYFNNARSTEIEAHRAAFEFSELQREKIRKHLVDNGILVSASDLITFIREAIEGREYAKFVFTRSVSEVLRLITDFGAAYDLSKDMLSYLDIKTILDLYASLGPEDLPDLLRECSERNSNAYQSTLSLKLPQMITSERDIYEFSLSQVEPNFVTRSRVTEIVVREDIVLQVDLERKIVFITSADPGYDWLFSRNIAGLVTMFGGANSHMAIRCAELGIPAVIGCGEENFKRWGGAEILDMDCANRQVRVVR